MKRIWMGLSGLLVLIGLMLGGCTEDEMDQWKVSPKFTENEWTYYYGKAGKLGLIKINGGADEPGIPVDEGRLYALDFLDESMDFGGKQYEMIATHKETGKKKKLYKAEIENNQSGAKFALDKEGIWKIDVTVDGKEYAQFFVEASKIN